MDYQIENAPFEKLKTDYLVVGIYEGQNLSPSAETVNTLTNDLICNILKRGDLEGKVGETLAINYIPENTIERILLVGLGKQDQPLSRKNFRKALTSVIKVLKSSKIKTMSCALTETNVADSDCIWKTRQVVEIFADNCYKFQQCKSIKDPEMMLETIRFITEEVDSTATQQGIQQGQAIAEGVSLAKQLADLPGNVCTPTYLADQASQVADCYDKISFEALEEADMEKLGMGSFLSVSRGSRQPAKLITLQYQGAGKDDKPIVLIGKGLTFDAGGISLKPGAGMDEMKYDMCGGASVIGVLKAVAMLNLPLNIVGIVPSSENMPDGDANKPGDIVTSMSGKTIEILNTDAEGRLILCDALTYAEKFNPEVVIDLATLTGAVIVALGRNPTGLLGNDDALCADITASSETACDSVWRLPIWDEYQEQLKSNFADMANIGGKDAGTITAACFLSRFAENYRWAHLDIAGTAWRSGGANKGATGRPVPLLTQYLIDRANA
jgi:leucyl aminopeptidase